LICSFCFLVSIPLGSRVLKAKAGELFGMVEYDPEYTTEVIRYIICGERFEPFHIYPEVIAWFLDYFPQNPSATLLPAYLLFMMMRFMDITRNGDALSNLIKKAEDSVLWIVRKEQKTEIQVR